MTSTAACILAIVVLALFGITGVIAGVIWRRRSYYLPFSYLAIGLILAVLGIWTVLSQREQLAAWGTIMKWPSVQGVVVASNIAGERALHPEIIYEYSVTGSIYRDTTGFDTPSFGGRNAKRDVAETISATFPVGSPVTVHYDPAHPSRSLLRTSPDWSLFGKTGLGGTLFGIGFFLIVSARVKRS